MNEFLEFLKSQGIEITPAIEKKLSKVFNTAKEEGVEEGKKANVEGRLAREKKDLQKTVEADLAAELGLDSLEDVKTTLQQHKEEKFNSSVKDEFAKLKIDAKDKFFNDVINKAGITSETNVKEYKKLVEKVAKDFPEMFGANNDPTLNIPNAPTPLQIENEIHFNEDGTIDKTKIKDPMLASMMEITGS